MCNGTPLKVEKRGPNLGPLDQRPALSLLSYWDSKHQLEVSSELPGERFQSSFSATLGLGNSGAIVFSSLQTLHCRCNSLIKSPQIVPSAHDFVHFEVKETSNIMIFRVKTVQNEVSFFFIQTMTGINRHM